MSSSILSSSNCCGPVTGLLGNQTFLLHAQPQQKTISPPIWRTFYTPPAPAPAPTPASISQSIPSLNEDVSSGTDVSVTASPTLTPSPTAQQITLIVSPGNNNKNNNIQDQIENHLSQRMTLQKIPNSITENTTQAAGVGDTTTAIIQKSTIMSVSKLVRPTPKNHHSHHNQNQHQHQRPPQSQHHQHNHNHAALQQQQQQQQQQLNINYNTDVQSGPINLVTNTQSSDATQSRPSSTSSVDIESDDIPESQQQQQQQHHHNIGSVVTSKQQVPTMPAAYQFNYSHLYGNKPGYHSNAVAAAADTLRLHASYSYAAIAAVAAATVSSANNNIFPINAMSSTSLSHHQALAPPLSLASTITTNAVPNNVSPRSTDHHHHNHLHHQQQQHSQQHQQQSQQEQQKSQLNLNENLYSPPSLTAGLPNGTYLNCKTSPASDAESSTENYFKVPNTNGKEGSLKHRILTRPSILIDKEEKQTKNAVISTYNSTANFKKGSCIELANGVLRRVEDMRTEDFIQCAERSIHLKLAESTVVKIDTIKPHMVVITFSYDRNRSKADIEVSVDHPFFVYGQGWASCDPEKSHKAFGLKCQRLQVGDICISLTQRLTVSPSTIKTEVISKETAPPDTVGRYEKTDLSQSCDGITTVPMSIKTELQTVMPPPSLTTQVQYQHQRVPTAPPMHFIPCHMPTTSLPPHQIPYHDFPDLVAAAAAYNSGAHLHHLPTVMPPPPSPDAINGFYQQTQQLFLQGKVTAADLRLQPPSTSTAALSYCPPRTLILPPPPQSPMLEHAQEQPFDASIASRKRRWSAPEGDCDDIEDKRDHCQNSKLYKTVMAPVTT